MSESDIDDLIKRLDMFEVFQLQLSDQYGAEVLHRTKILIRKLEKELIELRNIIRKATTGDKT